MDNFEFNEIQPSIFLMKIDGNLQGGSQAMEFSEKLIDLLKFKPKVLIVDLSNIKLINSSGIGMLVNGFNSLKQHNIDFVLINLTLKIQNLLEMTHLNKVLKIRNNLDEALNEYK